MSIVVVGNVFVDIKGFPDDVYIPAGRNAGKVEFVHGGVGRNVVEDIANVQLHPRFVSMVDDNAEGQEVLDRLKNSGVDTEYLVQCPDGMGLWLAVFDHTGDVVAAISKRPDMQPMVDMLKEKGDEIFADADGIVIEIDNDAEVAEQVFRYAEKYQKKVYAVVANMSIAIERREHFRKLNCFICNEQEAGILFADNFENLTMEEMADKLADCVIRADFNSMVVTAGSRGAVYADKYGDKGIYPANKVTVRDTTGAGDAFCAGVAVGLTYGKDLRDAVEIGTRLASSVIKVMDNVCPKFLPEEFGLRI